MRFIAELDESKKTYLVTGDFSADYIRNSEITEWLDDTPGQGYSIAYSTVTYGKIGYFFYNEKDAMLFTLKWV